MKTKEAAFAKCVMIRPFRPLTMAFVLALNLVALVGPYAQERLVIHSPDIHLAGPHAGGASKHTLHTSGMMVDLSLDGKTVGVAMGNRKPSMEPAG